jgi:predicted permease
MRSFHRIEQVWIDTLHGLRRHVTHPVQSIGLTALIAIAISANTAAFSIFNTLMVQRLPVPAPDTLVWFGIVRPGNQPEPDRGLPYRFFEDLSTASSFAGVIAQTNLDVAVRNGDALDRISVQAVSETYFDVLGISPAAGRFFSRSGVNANPDVAVAVVSHSYWMSRFAGSADVIGASLVLNRQPFTIIGVTPKAFTGLSVDESPDARVMISQIRTIAVGERGVADLTDFTFTVAARRKPGVSLLEAEYVASSVWQSVSQALYGSSASASVQLQEKLVRMRAYSLAYGLSSMRSQYSAAILFVTAASALFFALASVSAGLAHLAALSTRRHEFATRHALGATRRRLLGQVMAESAGPIVLGGIAGVVVALVLLAVFPGILANSLNNASLAQGIRERLRLDGMTAAVSVAMVTVILFVTGAVPALQGAVALVSTRIAESRSSYTSFGRRILVMVQAALCVVMIGFAYVLVHTAIGLHRTELGVDRTRLISVLIEPVGVPGQERLTNAELQDVLARIRILPIVEEVAVSSKPMFQNTGARITVVPTGRSFVHSDLLNVSVTSVSPSYFDTSGMRVMMGRGYTNADLRRKTAPYPVVVNEVFVEKVLRSEHPVGMTFDTGATVKPNPTYEVVGVVSNANYRSVREPVPPTAYQQMDLNRLAELDKFGIYIRTRARAEDSIYKIKQELLATGLRKYRVRTSTVEEDALRSIWKEVVLASMSLFFALFAALVAAVGIFGAIAAETIPRTAEIGVRMALGATRKRLIRWIIAKGLRTILPGAAMGIFIYWLQAPSLESLAHGIAPAGFATLLVALAIFFALVIPALLYSSWVILRGDIWAAIRIV